MDVVTDRRMSETRKLEERQDLEVLADALGMSDLKTAEDSLHPDFVIAVDDGVLGIEHTLLHSDQPPGGCDGGSAIRRAEAVFDEFSRRAQAAPENGGPDLTVRINGTDWPVEVKSRVGDLAEARSHIDVDAETIRAVTRRFTKPLRSGQLPHGQRGAVFVEVTAVDGILLQQQLAALPFAALQEPFNETIRALRTAVKRSRGQDTVLVLMLLDPQAYRVAGLFGVWGRCGALGAAQTLDESRGRRPRHAEDRDGSSGLSVPPDPVGWQVMVREFKTRDGVPVGQSGESVAAAHVADNAAHATAVEPGLGARRVGLDLVAVLSRCAGSAARYLRLPGAA